MGEREDVASLVAVVPPPDEVPQVDWPEVFTALGTELPPDYVALIDTYGGGCFDGYLWLLAPDTSYGLLEVAEEREKAFEELFDWEDRPCGAARVIPWATTDNGEYVYWIVDGEPAEWVVAVDEARGDGWERHEMGCVEFLRATLTGEVRCELFWGAYPAQPHTFEVSERDDGTRPMMKRAVLRAAMRMDAIPAGATFTSFDEAVWTERGLVFCAWVRDHDDTMTWSVNVGDAEFADRPVLLSRNEVRFRQSAEPYAWPTSPDMVTGVAEGFAAARGFVRDLDHLRELLPGGEIRM